MNQEFNKQKILLLYRKTPYRRTSLVPIIKDHVTHIYIYIFYVELSYIELSYIENFLHSTRKTHISNDNKVIEIMMLKKSYINK